MRYLHVTWRHTNADDPVELFSELDEQSWEVRKVEVFPDGRVAFASATETTETTRLGLEPVPALDQIARDPQFVPEEISKAEFEHVWDSARALARAG